MVLASTVALVGLAAVYAWQARTAYVDLRSAQDRVGVLRQQIADGDLDGARATAERFADETTAARQAVHGPHWAMIGVLPVLGANVEAVQTVTATVDDLAVDTLPDLIAAAETVAPERMAPVKGRVDVRPLREVAPRIQAAHRDVAAAEERVTGVDTAQLVPQLRSPVADLAATLTELSGLTGTATRLAELIPPMLGADGPRDYLLLAQNTAEPRALGGIPGAVIAIRADHGRVELVEHRTGSSFGNRGRPVLRLSSAERALFGTQLGRYMQNVTSTPDFPRAARLARRMWADETGTEVDGVASIDPYALQLLLRATGPVTVPGGGRLTGDNAAQVLLNQVYIDYPDPDAQDAFFASAAARVFDKVMSGEGDLRATAKALVEATEQGRILLWSARAPEQAVLATTALAGELRGEQEDSPVVGVYLHDRSGAKIAYYERMRVEVAETDCRADGAKDLTVSVRLTSAVPRDVEGLPDYLTGGGVVVPEGQIRTDVLLYAPSNGMIEDVRASTGGGVTPQVHAGLPVVSHTVVIPPGKSVTLDYELSVVGLPGKTRLRTTPSAIEGNFRRLVSHCP